MPCPTPMGRAQLPGACACCQCAGGRRCAALQAPLPDCLFPALVLWLCAALLPCCHAFNRAHAHACRCALYKAGIKAIGKLQAMGTPERARWRSRRYPSKRFATAAARLSAWTWCPRCRQPQDALLHSKMLLSMTMHRRPIASQASVGWHMESFKGFVDAYSGHGDQRRCPQHLMMALLDIASNGRCSVACLMRDVSVMMTYASGAQCSIV